MKKITLPILLIVAVIFAFFYFSKQKNSTSTVKPDGKVISLSGNALIKEGLSKTYRPLKEGDTFNAPARLVLGHKVLMALDYGSGFSVIGESTLELKKEGEVYNVFLLSGEIEKHVSEKIVPLDIYVNNQIVDQKRVKVKSKKTNILKLSLAELKFLNEKTPASREKNLEDSLKGTLKYQTRFLERCFIKHYEEKKGATQPGVIQVKFTVLPKGRFESVEIAQSDYNDQNFHDCIKEVFSRVKLKGFKGSKQSVLFPIQVTLP